MADEEGAVHYTFADNLAPYFLLIFSPIFVIFCLFGIFYTYITTEVSYLKFRGQKLGNIRLKNLLLLSNLSNQISTM